MESKLGYKIFYNGKEFELDDSTSTISQTSIDSPISFVPDLNTGSNLVRKLNKRLKYDVYDLSEPGDIAVCRCKSCNYYFVLTAELVFFYQRKNLHIPARCDKCRKARKLRGNRCQTKILV